MWVNKSAQATAAAILRRLDEKKTLKELWIKGKHYKRFLPAAVLKMSAF